MVYIVLSSVCLSVCLSVTLSSPKWLCRNSPNVVVMITTWQEGSRAVSFLLPCPSPWDLGPWSWVKRSNAKKYNYEHIWKLFAYAFNIGGRRKYATIFWIWSPIHAPGGHGFEIEDFSSQNLILGHSWWNILPSFNFAFGGRCGGFAIACLHSSCVLYLLWGGRMA